MSEEEAPKVEQIAPTLTRILLTPERVEAIRRAILALEEEQAEYRNHTYPTARDFEIEKAVSVLEEMIEII